jgi:hypothetical protein
MVWIAGISMVVLSWNEITATTSAATMRAVCFRDSRRPSVDAVAGG